MRRTDRLFKIIQILRRSKKPVTAERLADELEVTKRSIYRDMAELFAQRVPIRGEAGVGYVIDREFDMPPLMLTADELEAAVLGAQWVAERADPALALAARDLIAKLSASVTERLRTFISEPTVGTPGALSSPIDGLDMTTVRQWIRGGKKMRIRYEDESGRRTRRTIWPVMIGYAERARLVAAWCELRRDFRAFRTERISDAEFLDARIDGSTVELVTRWRRHMELRGARP